MCCFRHICSISGCEKSFGTVQSLQRHLREVHAQVECAWICETCNKTFYSKGALQKHATAHSDARPFICDTCGRGRTISNICLSALLVGFASHFQGDRAGSFYVVTSCTNMLGVTSVGIQHVAGIRSDLLVPTINGVLAHSCLFYTRYPVPDG